MKILFAASEMVPFCKTGGLADVIGALPPVLADMGHDVSVMLPGYAVIDRKGYGFKRKTRRIDIPVGGEIQPLAVSSAQFRGITVYLLENGEYFGRKGLYGDAAGDYSDNGFRFVFFSRGVLEAAKRLRFRPDIVHTHDWQTGLVNTYLATSYANDPWFMGTATLFTIHNLGYQGIFPADVFSITGLPREEFHWTKLEYYGNLSLIKGGIVYADAVSTVSETYAEEITGESMGFGLHDVLAERSGDLYGIVNGIDENLWNPSKDRSIPAVYSAGDMEGKKICRKALLDACGLQAGVHVPVLSMVSRLDVQKGLDILEDAISKLMAMDIRMVILGTGAEEHQEKMRSLAARYSGSLHVTIGFDNDLAKLMYAGSDAFIMPSKYEPCGLGQLIAMKYGTLPIVHSTGGLADTVRDIDARPDDGNGFAIHEYSSDALVKTVRRAVTLYRKTGRRLWKKTVDRAMKGDFSWKKSAEKYSNLYKQIGNFNKK